MLTGAFVLLVGVAMVVCGSVISHRKVKQVFGRVDQNTARLSEGTGIVPAWVSFGVLSGYVLIVVGVVFLIVGL